MDGLVGGIYSLLGIPLLITIGMGPVVAIATWAAFLAGGMFVFLLPALVSSERPGFEELPLWPAFVAYGLTLLLIGYLAFILEG